MIPGGQDRFFSRLPEFARLYAIPYELSQQGVQKHGRDGVIHRWALERITNKTGQKFHKVIGILIGEHTNLAAIRAGQPIDVSDGFSRLDGLFSETRCGAIDSSVIFQMLGDGISGERIEEVLSQESGFKALAGGECTLNHILQRRDSKAKFAKEVFCYQILKYIGAFTASLGGVDLILFVGEGSLQIRRLAFDLTGHLRFMGVKKKAAVPSGEIAWLTTRGSTIKVCFINCLGQPAPSPRSGR
ncbi:MAG TPA: hypothetical protein PLB05_03995 [Candidatus Omnitrophota bacterium]|nr:hypothetical protein [Candidatus Omnitrophota bacterium]HPN56482.1 hypothetical protein [Candidatus Omnitrophota bacterium]